MKRSMLLSSLGIALLAGSAYGIFQSSKFKKKPMPVLNHLAVSVSDLNKSTFFYRDIIGIDTIPEPFHDGKHTWFQIGPVSQLHLIENEIHAVKSDKNNHLCFSVESMEEFIDRLNRNKVAWSDWPGKPNTVTTRVDGIKQIYLQDPDGNWIEINNDYPKPSGAR